MKTPTRSQLVRQGIDRKQTGLNCEHFKWHGKEWVCGFYGGKWLIYQLDS